MSAKLDKYEQELEDSFDQQISIKSEIDLAKIQKVAQEHLKKKKSITIRLAVHDLEAIKIKASKLGLAYQTYINMLIHKDAIKL